MFHWFLQLKSTFKYPSTPLPSQNLAIVNPPFKTCIAFKSSTFLERLYGQPHGYGQTPISSSWLAVFHCHYISIITIPIVSQLYPQMMGIPLISHCGKYCIFIVVTSTENPPVAELAISTPWYPQSTVASYPFDNHGTTDYILTISPYILIISSYYILFYIRV